MLLVAIPSSAAAQADPPSEPDWHPSSGLQPHHWLAPDESFGIHPERPRLYFRREDVAWLLERGAGPLAEQWDELAWMASSMASEDPVGDRATASVAGWYGTKGRAVALMARLTDNPTYVRWAVDWAIALGGLSTQTNDTQLRARTERMAVVYDWLYDRMSDADRATLRDSLVAYVEALQALGYIQEPGYIGGHERWGYAVLAMALIALGDDYDDPDGLLLQARSHIAHGFYPAQAWIAEDGGYHMGWAYTSTYTNVDLPFLTWTVGTNDVLLDDWMADLGDWYLYGLRGDDTLPASGNAYSIDPTLAAKSVIYAAGVGGRGHARWYLDSKVGPRKKPFLQLLLLDPDTPQEAPGTLAEAKLFRNAGVVVARDRWDADTTHFVFKSSSFYSDNHHHRDQNTFTLHYRAPLAIDSGYYDAYGSPHFLNYFTRTIAHNGIVVYDPTQTMSRYGAAISNDGGQVFRTDPDTLEDIVSGGHASLDGILFFENRDAFTYALGDATKAYDPERVSLAQREVVYLRQTDRPHPVVVVFDRISSTSADFDKRFLLHTTNEPIVDGRLAVAENGDGRLSSVTLYPSDALLTVVGGVGEEFLVDGANYPLDPAAVDKAAAAGIDTGSWRLEVAPATAAVDDHFLHALFVDDAGATPVDPSNAVLLEDTDALGIQTAGWVVVFPRSPDPLTTSVAYRVQQAGSHHHLVTGFAAGESVAYSVDGVIAGTVVTGTGGTAVFELTAQSGAVVLVGTAPTSATTTTSTTTSTSTTMLAGTTTTTTTSTTIPAPTTTTSTTTTMPAPTTTTSTTTTMPAPTTTTSTTTTVAAPTTTTTTTTVAKKKNNRGGKPGTGGGGKPRKGAKD